MRRRGWLALLALALGGVLPGGRLAAQGGADSVLTGTLHLVWGDPEEGEAPRYVALLTDSSGVVRPLAVDGRDHALVTALQQLNGQRVRATTQAEALRPLSLAASPQAAVDRAVRAVAPALG